MKQVLAEHLCEQHGHFTTTLIILITLPASVPLFSEKQAHLLPET